MLYFGSFNSFSIFDLISPIVTFAKSIVSATPSSTEFRIFWEMNGILHTIELWVDEFYSTIITMC